MKMVGFIDLQEDWDGMFETLPVSVFKENSKGFELAAGLSPADIKDFYLSLPLGLLNFRMLKLPFSDKGKLRKIIPFELENLIMISPDNIVFDAIVLGGSEGSFDVLAVYTEKVILRDILAKLSSLDIDPNVVTSIDLRSVVKGAGDDIAARLMDTKGLSAGDRMKAAAEEMKSNTINLRTGQFAFTKGIEKLDRRLKAAAVLLMLLAIAIHSDLAFRLLSANREAAAIKKEIRAIYSGIFPEEKKISDELYQMKAHMKGIQEKGDALIGVYPLQLLLDLSQKRVQGAVFNEISIDKDTMTIKGEAALMDDVGKIKAKVSESMKDVSVADIKPSVAGKVMFTVIAKRQI